MDPRYQRLPNVNLAHQRMPPMQKTTLVVHSSTVSVHGSSVNQNYLISPQKNSRRSFSWHLLLYVFSFMWLVPIATLLALNYTNYVAGPSVWCPLGRCSSDMFTDDALKKAKQLDKDDHTVLGALQIVAKVLETWFMLIGTHLVYDLSMIFAKKGGGLPVGYFLTYREFGDLRNLFNRLMWTSPIPHPNGHQPRQVKKFKLYIFAIFVAFLTILTNLMGPATAVLMLPTLQWVGSQPFPELRFQETDAARPPRLLEPFSHFGPFDNIGCKEEDLSAQNYSCTLDFYGPILDEWAMSIATQKSQGTAAFPKPWQEKSLQFMINRSSESDITWVPNRQALGDLSFSLHGVSGESFEYNNSLQTILSLEGPAIGLRSNCFCGSLKDTEISKDKHVICYSGWTSDQIAFYDQCFPWGKDWNITNSKSSFFIGAPNTTGSTDPDEATVAVSNYFTQKAIFWNSIEDFGSGVLDCLNRDTTMKSCDWEKIFATSVTGPFQNMSTNVGLVEYDPLVNGRPTNHSRNWCVNVAYLGFPIYTVDSSRSSNPSALVEVHNLTNPDNSWTPLVVNPNWLLAAWSVDHSKTVDGTRPSAKLVSRLSRVDPSDSHETHYEWGFISGESLFHYISMCQALSLISYYGDEGYNSTAVLEDAPHPILQSWYTRHVWAYSFSGRTAKLGAAVVIAGAFCVLLHITVGIFARNHKYTIVELFVAALKHIPQGEFLNYNTEKAIAKVRYQLREDGDGKVIFQPERNGGYTSS